MAHGKKKIKLPVLITKKKIHDIRAGEMAQQLKSIVALAEDPSSNPSIHTVAHNWNIFSYK